MPSQQEINCSRQTNHEPAANILGGAHNSSYQQLCQWNNWPGCETWACQWRPHGQDYSKSKVATSTIGWFCPSMILHRLVIGRRNGLHFLFSAFQTTAGFQSQTYIVFIKALTLVLGWILRQSPRTFSMRWKLCSACWLRKFVGQSHTCIWMQTCNANLLFSSDRIFSTLEVAWMTRKSRTWRKCLAIACFNTTCPTFARNTLQQEWRAGPMGKTHWSDLGLMMDQPWPIKS